MTNAATDVPARRQRTTAEFWADFFGGVKSTFWIGLAFGAVYYLAWGYRSADQAGYLRGKAAGQKDGYKSGLADGKCQGRKQGRKLGGQQWIGKAKPLSELTRYRFHGEFTIAKKRYGLLVPPDSLEPQLYELDARKFPGGFPPVGGILRPVKVYGYFQPVDPNALRVPAKPKAKRVKIAPRPKSANPGAITRQSSRAIPPRDWPMVLPALPPVSPKIFNHN